MNYWEERSLSPFSKKYLFVDHRGIIAQSLCIPEEIYIDIKVEDTIMNVHSNEYRLITCTVSRNKARKFEEILDTMSSEMARRGYAEYDEICNIVTSRRAFRKYLSRNEAAGSNAVMDLAAARVI